MSLDPESQELLAKRRAKGNEAMRVSWGRWPRPDERESAATDAISDILTALLGPAGTTSYGGHIEYDAVSMADAQNLLRRALDSYRGDAEDYVRDPDPGEYGFEDDAA